MPSSFSAVGGAHIIVFRVFKPASFPKDTDLGMEKGGSLYSLRMLRAEYVIIIRMKNKYCIKK